MSLDLEQYTKLWCAEGKKRYNVLNFMDDSVIQQISINFQYKNP